MNFITNNIKTDTIPYEILCKMNESPVSLGHINNVVYSTERRKILIEEGYKIGQSFMDTLSSQK